MASALLKRQDFLDVKDKAMLVIQMLDKSVKDKLKGDNRIVNPETPEQIFTLLRTVYPDKQLQLSTEMTACRNMQDSQQ